MDTMPVLPGPAPKPARKPRATLPEPAAAPKVEPDKPFVPVLLHRVAPVYPRFARRRGVEGAVLVEFNLDTQGTVQDPQVLSAEPAGVFEQSALSALREWRFAPPGTVRRVRQRIEFKLQ